MHKKEEWSKFEYEKNAFGVRVSLSLSLKWEI